MLSAFLLLTALCVSDIPSTDLEKYYLDGDTSFMQGSLGGQDMNSCLKITEQFQKVMFNSDRDAFMDYWNNNKQRQWERRGYFQL
ncbi:MAG: hypothetical protein EXR37_06130 [Limnohabitans sp.]|nr:hypothetical protein [Limnohabitans sp.]